MRYKSDGILLDQQEIDSLPKSHKCPVCGRRKLSDRPCQSKLVTSKERVIYSIIHSVEQHRTKHRLSSFKDYKDGYNNAIDDILKVLRRKLKRHEKTN